MTALEIVALDAFDGAAVDAWHSAYLDAELAAGSGIASPWQLEEVRAVLQNPGSTSRQLGWSGILDGEVVAVGRVRMPLLDNLDRAEISVHVVPGHRRRGHGSAMLAHVEANALAQGRSILVGETTWSHGAGGAGRGEPGPEFAYAHGYELALGEVKRVVRLPVDERVLEALAAEAAERHAGYRLRSWVGPVPDDLLVGWARLASALVTEAPTGDLDIEAESADPDAVRDAEAVAARQGRTKFNTVALDPGGEVVAYTDLATTVHEPGKAYQWGTLVRRDARGHRLGLALKVANLRLLQREAPDVSVLTTYNAEVNQRMIEVNERLGFRPVARIGEFQKRT